MLCSHVLACAAGLRRHLIPCERGEPAAVPYPGVRPCKRGRPAAVPYPGRVSAAGRRLYISPAGAGRRPCYMLYCKVSCFERDENNDDKCVATKLSLTDLVAKFEIPYTLRSKRFLL